MKYPSRVFFGCLLVTVFLLSCRTVTGNPIDNNSKIFTPPKYPVVLVHGIVAHDRGGIINFWGRIPDILREKGVKVFFGNTDAWGSYESNANILKETIDKILDETKSEKVNIIAHSKGGLDSRYLIWHHDYGDKVASLITIATPHHGAEIADLIYSRDIVHTNIVKKILETFGRLYGDTNPDMFNVNHQLTTEKMREFNETVNMDNKVYYRSIYTTITNPLDDIMFFDSYRYIKRIRGDNDGIVSEWSAQWGKDIKKIEGGISHAEIVDYKMQEISGIQIPDIYINIVTELSEMGF
jgi:triacylglycerol esterase/lipase EstA (alpha/beta hydrolase family)